MPYPGATDIAPSSGVDIEEVRYLRWRAEALERREAAVTGMEGTDTEIPEYQDPPDDYPDIPNNVVYEEMRQALGRLSENPERVMSVKEKERLLVVEGENRDPRPAS